MSQRAAGRFRQPHADRRPGSRDRFAAKVAWAQLAEPTVHGLGDLLGFQGAGPEPVHHGDAVAIIAVHPHPGQRPRFVDRPQSSAATLIQE